MATVQVNVKLVVGCFAVGAIILYVTHAMWGNGKEHFDEIGAHLSGEHDHHDHEHPVEPIKSWKTRPFEDIPEELKQKMKNIKVIERHTNLEVSGKKLNIFSRQTDVTGEGKKFVVLLLHGMAFSSQNWVDIKTIHLIAAMGYRVVAVDLPGYGNSKASEVDEDDKAVFLTEFIKKENLGAPLIVSPSMSGSFALPYLMESDPSVCQQRATAYIPVAPVGTGQYSDSDYKQCQIPVMVVYGSDDTRLGVSSKANLQQFAIREIFPIADAGHACYMDKTEEWHKLVYNFIDAVTRYIS